MIGQPQPHYPSYKSFDPFIDIERLKALDGYVTERVERHLRSEVDTQFYTGPHRLDDAAPDRPGARMIYLKESTRPDDYFDLDRTELWKPTQAAAEFAELMDFIGTLPFRATGRILVIYDDVSREGPAHRDHDEREVCHEFVWFRTNLRKPFYMLNEQTREKLYVSSYSAWFDTVNQFHGTDPCPGLGISIRVDGVFTDAFRARIPVLPSNRAATPAVWARLAG